LVKNLKFILLKLIKFIYRGNIIAFGGGQERTVIPFGNKMNYTGIMM